VLGVHNQHREVSDVGIRIPGHDDKHQYLAGQPPSRQGETNPGRVHQNFQYDCSACLLSNFLGKLSAAARAIRPAPLFYRCLQRDLQAALANNQDYEALHSLSQSSQEELTWWMEHLTRWNGKPLMHKPEQVTISSDASQLGWGAACAENRTGGAWSVEEKTMHINSLELLAAL